MSRSPARRPDIAAAPRAPLSPHPSPALLALRSLREEIAAGIDGAGIRIRTLDDVSLAIHARELVVLRGAAGDGTTSLVRAIAGAGSRARGVRETAPGVRVRRASVAASAAGAIVRAWRATSEATGRLVAATVPSRVVYLLRVRPDDRPFDRAEASLAWCAWSALVHRLGGAVVLVDSSDTLGLGGGEVRRDRVAEGVGPAEPGVGSEPRVVTLAGGRVVSDSGYMVTGGE